MVATSDTYSLAKFFYFPRNYTQKYNKQNKRGNNQFKFQISMFIFSCVIEPKVSREMTNKWYLKIKMPISW